jgi:hypothetical protein
MLLVFLVWRSLWNSVVVAENVTVFVSLGTVATASQKQHNTKVRDNTRSAPGWLQRSKSQPRPLLSGGGQCFNCTKIIGNYPVLEARHRTKPAQWCGAGVCFTRLE